MKTKKMVKKQKPAAKVSTKKPVKKSRPQVSARICARCKKNPVKSKRSARCADCQALIRKRQLLANNATWRARVRKGKASHHVVYKGKPTKWAKENRLKAVLQMKKYAAPSVDPFALKKLLKLA